MIYDILHGRCQSYWFEGPKLDCPLKLMKANPSGQSQRYQIQNYGTYFSRWANHVSSAYIASKKINNIVCINYSDLLENHSKTIEDLCNQFSIRIIEEPKMPNKSNYIKGMESLKITDDLRNKMYDYCQKELVKYEYLPSDLVF